VSDGETVIFEKKRPKVAPGEMESIKLKAEKLGNVNELFFSLEVL
jgi:hypothetical protein